MRWTLPHAATITLEGVRKRYPDGTVAVDELSLEVRPANWSC